MTEEGSKDFHIRVLKDGTMVLSCGPNDEYAYDTVDELLAGLKSELSDSEKPEEMEEEDISVKKKTVKKMMEQEIEDEE